MFWFVLCVILWMALLGKSAMSTGDGKPVSMTLFLTLFLSACVLVIGCLIVSHLMLADRISGVGDRLTKLETRFDIHIKGEELLAEMKATAEVSDDKATLQLLRQDGHLLSSDPASFKSKYGTNPAIMKYTERIDQLESLKLGKPPK